MFRLADRKPVDPAWMSANVSSSTPSSTRKAKGKDVAAPAGAGMATPATTRTTSSPVARRLARTSAQRRASATILDTRDEVIVALLAPQVTCQGLALALDDPRPAAVRQGSRKTGDTPPGTM